MAITPWRVGQLSPIWTISLSRDNSEMDLTGVTANQISLIIYNSSKVVTGTGAGAFAILQIKPGIVTYTPVSADIPSTAGQYYARIEVNFNGTSPDFSDYISWVIQS